MNAKHLFWGGLWASLLLAACGGSPQLSSEELPGSYTVHLVDVATYCERRDLPPPICKIVREQIEQLLEGSQISFSPDGSYQSDVPTMKQVDGDWKLLEEGTRISVTPRDTGDLAKHSPNLYKLLEGDADRFVVLDKDGLKLEFRRNQ